MPGAGCGVLGVGCGLRFAGCGSGWGHGRGRETGRGGAERAQQNLRHRAFSTASRLICISCLTTWLRLPPAVPWGQVLMMYRRDTGCAATCPCTHVHAGDPQQQHRMLMQPVYHHPEAAAPDYYRQRFDAAAYNEFVRGEYVST